MMAMETSVALLRAKYSAHLAAHLVAHLAVQRPPQTLSRASSLAFSQKRFLQQRLALRENPACCEQGCPLVAILVPLVFFFAPMRYRSQAIHRIPPRAAIRGRQAGQLVQLSSLGVRAKGFSVTDASNLGWNATSWDFWQTTRRYGARLRRSARPRRRRKDECDALPFAQIRCPQRRQRRSRRAIVSAQRCP